MKVENLTLEKKYHSAVEHWRRHNFKDYPTLIENWQKYFPTDEEFCLCAKLELGTSDVVKVGEHTGALDRAMDDEDRYWVLRVMAEELRHGYQMLHLLLTEDWSHVSGGVTGEQMVEEILSMQTGSHVLDAFNLDYDSFIDNICFAALVDRVGKYQLTMQRICAYRPMADSMPPMLREEAFH